jgi:16S rRNA pseudouridine516 synthase
MFAAVGNHVETLHRRSLGGLLLDDLPAGHWRELDDSDKARIFRQ